MMIPICTVVSQRIHARIHVICVQTAQLRPLMKYGLVHASLSSVFGVITETDNIPGAG